MRRLFLFPTPLVVLALVLTALGVSQGATEAGAVERFGRSAGPAVDAFWEFPEPGGGFSGVFVFAGEETVRTGGRPQTSQVVHVGIIREFPDHTAREIFGDAQLEPGDLVFSGDLDGATLEVTIPAHDCLFTGPQDPTEPPPPPDCTDTTISVDLTWTAVGSLGTHRGSFQDRFDGCIANGNFTFTGRPAEVTGTVTSGGTDYTRGETGFGNLIERGRDMFIGIGDCFAPPPEE